MAENSNIEWTDHTVNLWWGCSKVHTGCKNCYAETLHNRFDGGLWGENAERRRIKSAFNDLNKYQKQAKNKGVKVRVFMGSMMDIFEDSKTLINPSERPHTENETEQLRVELFNRISQGHYEDLIFLFLTKRPENVAGMIHDSWQSDAPRNVWIGTSISDQETATKYLKLLKDIPLGIHNIFLSVEPQVGPIILGPELAAVNWVIQGGESGSKKRPFEISWAESMRDECNLMGTPYFFKQIDKVQAIPDHLMIREIPQF